LRVRYASSIHEKRYLTSSGKFVGFTIFRQLNFDNLERNSRQTIDSALSTIGFSGRAQNSGGKSIAVFEMNIGRIPLGQRRVDEKVFSLKELAMGAVQSHVYPDLCFDRERQIQLLGGLMDKVTEQVQFNSSGAYY
jgi:hypothetical protein